MKSKISTIHIFKSYKFLLLISWMALIFVMSNQVATTSSGISSLFVEPIQPYAPGFAEDILTTLVRKSAHIFMYFVLGILVFTVLNDFIPRKKLLVGYSILFAFIYAVTDEIHQTLVPGRSGEIRDVLIDTIGASIGVLLCYWFVCRRRKHNKDLNVDHKTAE